MEPEEDPTPSLNLFSYGLHRWRRWGQKSEQRGRIPEVQVSSCGTVWLSRGSFAKSEVQLGCKAHCL